MSPAPGPVTACAGQSMSRPFGVHSSGLMPDDRRHPDAPSLRGGDVDDAFATLRNRERRFALYFLLEHETAPIEELADVVVGWTAASTGATASRRRRNRVYVDLVHSHVPAMADAGLVSYDETDANVSLSPCPDAIRSFVRRACEVETGPGNAR